MNYIWGVMLLTGIAYGIAAGNVSAVSDAVLSSSQEAVTLCITMLGVMGLWTGLMKIAEQAGIVAALSKAIRPLIRFLFPDIPEDHPANEQITLNCTANILGLGWAATPAGLRAMKALAQLEEERRKRGEETVPKGTASDEMCTFLILNISSLQMIPVTIIAYRAQYGSVNPAAVVGPGILATAASTIAAVLFCKLRNQWFRKKKNSGKI